MVQALQVPATEFSRSFSKYRDEVHSVEVIEVTAHGRVIGGYLSPKELARYRELKKRERQVILFSEFDEDMIAELENTRWGVISE